MNDVYLTTREISKRLGIGQNTALDWAKIGLVRSVPGRYQGKGCLLISLKDCKLQVKFIHKPRKKRFASREERNRSILKFWKAGVRNKANAEYHRTSEWTVWHVIRGHIERPKTDGYQAPSAKRIPMTVEGMRELTIKQRKAVGWMLYEMERDNGK